MTMKQATVYVFQNSLSCRSEAETRQLQRDLMEMVAPEVIHFFKNVVQHRVDLINDEAPLTTTQPANPSGQPGKNQPPPPPVKSEVTKSRITVTVNDKAADFKLDLVFDGSALVRLTKVMELMVCNLRQEVEAAAGTHAWRHDLAEAGRKLGELGLQKPPGNTGHSKKLCPAPSPWPPSRAGFSTKRSGQGADQPGRLDGRPPALPGPYTTLYNNINFDKSWRRRR